MKISLWLLAVFFCVAGVYHFMAPNVYLDIMPPGIPWPLAMVYISGLAEVAGGCGVLVPQTRLMAGWGLIALLLAVLPANIYMLTKAMHESHGLLYFVLLWARLPFQFVFIAWVYRACIRKDSRM